MGINLCQSATMCTMALRFHDKKSAERIDELHRSEEEDLARVLSDKYGVEYTDLTRKSIDSDALKLIDEKKARSAEIAPFKKIGKRLFIGMRSPDRSDSLQEVKKIQDLGYKVRRFIVSSSSLERAWERYKDLSFATQTQAGVLTISNDAIQKMIDELKTIQDVASHVSANVGSKNKHRSGNHYVRRVISWSIRYPFRARRRIGAYEVPSRWSTYGYFKV
jgi:Mg2+ and Co2+ transporter CorA